MMLLKKNHTQKYMDTCNITLETGVSRMPFVIKVMPEVAASLHNPYENL